MEEKSFLKKIDLNSPNKNIVPITTSLDKNGKLSHDEAIAIYGTKYADELWKSLRVFRDEEIDIKEYLSQMAYYNNVVV